MTASRGTIVAVLVLLGNIIQGDENMQGMLPMHACYQCRGSLRPGAAAAVASGRAAYHDIACV
jgi:hypothetical protein